MTILGRNKDHSSRDHVRSELSIMSCSAVDELIGSSKFICAFFNKANQFLIKVNGITLPSHFNFACAFRPFFGFQSLDDSKNLFQNFWIFMSNID